MRATAWNNGSHTPSGAGYGFRVSQQNRDLEFRRHWTHITVALPTGVDAEVPLSASFWRRCSELRSAHVGRWLIAEGLAPWPKGQPPVLALEHRAGTQFTLSRAGQP